MRRAAAEYGRRGELGWALQLLLASGDAGEAAAMLAGTPPEVVETVDALELRALFDQLPSEVVDVYPNVLLLVARACRLATQFDQGAVLLERARDIALGAGDRALERAVAVELVHDLVRELRHREAEDAARLLLDEAEPGEQATRARAYHALGQALCWRTDSTGRRDEAALAEAEGCFTRATNLYRALGMRSALSALAPYWALMIEFAGGRAAAAMDRLEKALTLVSDRPRR
jgi:ATP/maltotriose-dependent transcriptional regulator MalT